MTVHHRILSAVAGVAGSLALAPSAALAGLGVTIDNSLKSGGQTAPYSYGFKFNVAPGGATVVALDLALQSAPTLNVRLYKYNSVSQVITQLASADVTHDDPIATTSGQIPEGGTVPQLGSPSSGVITLYQHFLDTPITLMPEANTSYYVAGDLPLGNLIYNQARVDQLHTDPSIIYNHSVSSRGEFGDNPIYDYLSNFGTSFRAGWNANITVATVGHWTGSTSGAWPTGGNWTGSVPNGVGHIAFFDAATTPNSTVTLATAKTLGSMRFDSTVGHQLTGPGPLTLDADSSTASVTVNVGSHTIGVPVVLNDNLNVDVAAGGVINFTNSLSAANRTVTKEGAGVVQFANLRAGTAAVTEGTLRISPKATPNQDAGTNSVTSLAVSSGAAVDLTNNSLIVDYAAGGGAVATDDIRVALKDGRLLTSSGSAGQFKIGYVDNATLPTVLTSFGGQTVDASSLLLKFTRNGDATLNGIVDFDDLVVLAQNYGGSDKVWAQGDNTYNGIVDFDDLVALAQNYGQSLSLEQQSLLSSDFASDYALALSLVPEPASFVVAFGVAGVLLRRRRVALI